MPKDSLIDLVRVLILTRLNFCNSLYYGLPDFLLKKLQRIVNCACRLIFRLSLGTSEFMKQLHWLPVRKRFLFRILLMGHRLVHHPVPDYLNSLVSRKGKVTRSQYIYKFQTPTLKTDFGKRSFSFAVPHEWNRLPFEIKLLPKENAFRKKLETFLF